MINKINADRIDEVVDRFEDKWSLDSRNQIPSLLEQFGLSDDGSAATELIRIDIELRYRQGITIHLDDYLDEFGSLLVQPGAFREIAFEDYRSREAYGHPISSSRWRGIPGIDNESWFRQLSQRQPEVVPARHMKDVDESFESALEEFGFCLIHELGRGAFSQVFLATQNDLADRYVVLKVIDKALSEPQNMAMLQHTNIVPIYSFDRILSRSVICMPYAGRVTLADFLKGEKQVASRGGQSLVTTVLNHVQDTVNGAEASLSPAVIRSLATPAADDDAVLKPLERLRSMQCNELALWLFQRLAAALAHSHARGVLHGDLKPANILIRNDGEPALLDFNLSQTLDHEYIRHAGGTLPYMSPEMFRGLMGQAIKPHAASDIFSLGVMLYQFVTGRMPFPTPASSAAIDIEPAIISRKQPVIWNESDHVSPGSRAIIEKCLAFDVNDRYESAELLQLDLERELKSEPLMVAKEPATARTKKWFRRHPKLVSGGSVAALLIALIIPLAFAAIVARNRSLHLAATAMLDSFTDESAKVLSTVMVDPLRYRDDAITISMVPLNQFGIFDDDALQALDSPLMTTAERIRYRDSVVRHIAQLSFHELARLKAIKELSPTKEFDAKTLQRIDKLLAGALRYQSQSDSRGLTLLAAERAQLGGDQETFAALTAKATNMPMETDSEKYLEAVRLMSLGHWPAASELLTSLADRNSIPSAVRWTSLGRSQFSNQQYEQAKISFTQSIERAPDSSRLWLLRGLCYFQLRKYALAEADFAKTIELEPSFVSGWLNRGVSRMAQKKFTDAVDDFTSGLKHVPGHIHLLLMRSRAHDRLGMIEESKRDLADALKSDYTDASGQALARRAMARRKLGDYEGALNDLNRAQQLNPRSTLVLKGKALLFAAHLDRLQDAIDQLLLVESFQPNDETAIIDRAVYQARIGQAEQAKQALWKAIAPPNLPRTLYQAACVNALLVEQEPKRKTRALSFLSKAILQGYGAEDFDKDPDLASLRELDGYQAIKRTVGLNNLIRAKGQTKSDAEPLEIDTQLIQ